MKKEAKKYLPPKRRFVPASVELDKTNAIEHDFNQLNLDLIFFL